jgi:cell division septum initiation protein DivIVA
MDPIDQLLAQLGSSPANLPSPTTVPKSTSPETESGATSGKSITAGANKTIDDLLRSLGEPAKQTVRDQLQASPPTSASLARSLPVPEIQSYQQEQVAIELAAQEKQQQQARMYEQRQAALAQQRRQDLRQQAQAWLQKLDKKSVEGRWFEDFACHYESPLDAAIEYFVALQEINSPLPTPGK